MDYKALFNNLSRRPPAGWRAIHSVANAPGGVYLWPSHIPHLIEPPNVASDGRLLHFSMLFEFHVLTRSNHARILARARFHANEPEKDFRWKTWREIAQNHCGATTVKEAPAKYTKSVGLWDNNDFQKIGQKPSIVADKIRSFFDNPPPSFTCFVGHL